MAVPLVLAYAGLSSLIVVVVQGRRHLATVKAHHTGSHSRSRLQIHASRGRRHAGRILPCRCVGRGNKGHRLNSTNVRHSDTNWQRFRCLGWNLSCAMVLGDSWNRLLHGYCRGITGPCGLRPWSTCCVPQPAGLATWAGPVAMTISGWVPTCPVLASWLPAATTLSVRFRVVSLAVSELTVPVSPWEGESIELPASVPFREAVRFVRGTPVPRETDLQDWSHCSRLLSHENQAEQEICQRTSGSWRTRYSDSPWYTGPRGSRLEPDVTYWPRKLPSLRRETLMLKSSSRYTGSWRNWLQLNLHSWKTGSHGKRNPSACPPYTGPHGNRLMRDGRRYTSSVRNRLHLDQCPWYTDHHGNWLQHEGLQYNGSMRTGSSKTTLHVTPAPMGAGFSGMRGQRTTTPVNTGSVSNPPGHPMIPGMAATQSQASYSGSGPPDTSCDPWIESLSLGLLALWRRFMASIPGRRWLPRLSGNIHNRLHLVTLITRFLEIIQTSIFVLIQMHRDRFFRWHRLLKFLLNFLLSSPFLSH